MDTTYRRFEFGCDIQVGHLESRKEDPEMQRMLLELADGPDRPFDTTQIATRLNVDYNTARKYVNGSRRPTLEQMIEIGKFAAERGQPKLLKYIIKKHFGDMQFDAITIKMVA